MPPLTRTVVTGHPITLVLTLSELRHGRFDPTMRWSHGHVWRAFNTPGGPTTVQYRQTDERVVEVSAWGDGAAWAVEQAPAQLGANEDLSDFDASLHPVVARAHHAHPGLRIGASGQVQDTLVQTIFGQKVTGLQAVTAWQRLVERHGTAAPGPAATGDGAPRLMVAPTPSAIARLPYWELHPMGVERKRAEIVLRSCRRMNRLEEAVHMPADAAWERMNALPGLGPWTAAIVLRVARGDPDLVETGDYHLPDVVAWNLAGEPRADDERMLELLDPFTGHRGRVSRLIAVGGVGKPKYGPRLSPHLVENL